MSASLSRLISAKSGIRWFVMALLAALCVSCATTTTEYSQTQTPRKGTPPVQGSGPRNVIVMISDGCSFNHVLATNYYQDGEAGAQRYQQTFTSLAMTTYPDGGAYEPEEIWAKFENCRQGATDSAAAATAMASGMKTYSKAIGVDPGKQPVRNAVEAAEACGKATGVITTVEVSHATPAGFVAHNESRSNCDEIGNEMFRESAVDVIMGAGHPDFDSDGVRQPPEEDEGKRAKRYWYVGGEETWRDLEAGTPMADADGDGTPDGWSLVQTREEFKDLVKNPPKRVAGIVQAFKTTQERRASLDGKPEDDAPYETPLIETVPTLAEMTRGALAVLGQDPDGLFLMIEGGAIDWASHRNQLGRMIEEQIDFHGAVDAVIDWVEANGGWDENLVIITADHDCGYIWGPDSDPEWKPLENRGKGRMPGAVWYRGGHTNSLVPFYIRGAGAEDFKARATGTDPVHGAYLDNTDIGQVIQAFFDNAS